MTPAIKDVTVGINGGEAASHTVSAGLARNLVEVATARGANAAALFAAANLPPESLAEEDSRIPFARYVALYAAAERFLADTAFALRLGECLDGMDLLVCHVGSGSATMRDALDVINRYGRLAIDVETFDGGDPFQVEHSVEGTWLIDASLYPGDAPQLTETSFARLITGTRQLSERRFVRLVHLRRSEPSARDEYERVFGAPVMFGQQRNAMLMDPDWFSLELPSASPYAHTVLEAHAERLLAELNPNARGPRSAAEMVADRITSEARTMTAVARDLGMSRATLYRALRAEGTTFEKIAESVRSDLATRLLRDGRSIAETAELLGFSDRSAFSRAFKRWTGTSPGSA
ncbi:MAG TPA: AraC family transcriptional regulator ligand-binding domain-containing protein [Thermoanaerobaculia bacterium]